jgi:hypothetical protein
MRASCRRGAGQASAEDDLGGRAQNRTEPGRAARSGGRRARTEHTGEWVRATPRVVSCGMPAASVQAWICHGPSV